MPTISKVRRLVNPGRRIGERRLTPLQKLYFGSKRQRAAVRANRGAKGHRKRRNGPGFSKLVKRVKRAVSGIGKRRKVKRARVGNVGEILAFNLNPGKVNKMAAHRRKRKSSGVSRVHRKRRRNTTAVVRVRHHRVRHRRRNPAVSKVVYRYRNKSHRRAKGRRRNPGFLTSGEMGKVFGVIGGAVVTKKIMDMLPASLSTGMLGYLSTFVVAKVQGKLVGKVFKSPGLGANMEVGGYVVLALKLLNDFLPSFGIPFGLRGMGLLSSSNFYVPQVPRGGSMAEFVTPAGIAAYIPQAAAAGMHGLGKMSNRRVGRMS